ncbi:MAG: maleylacetoacetate isomerase [Burkholderiales bacterium]|nr:maleylacetoacetate isomerase [Burkholderiales bacterium]
MSSTPLLYQGTLSSSSWRLRIALALKGIAYESVRIDISRDEQLKPEFSPVLPARQVPCLAIDGQLLYQSVAILEYLEETRPTPRLLPSNPAARAQVRAVVEVINSVIQPLHNTPVRKRLQAQFGLSVEDGNAWSRYWIEHRFDDLERQIQTTRGEYCFGDEVTLADVFLYPQVASTVRFDADMSRFPNLAAICANLRTLPAFRDSHPPELQ